MIKYFLWLSMIMLISCIGSEKPVDEKVVQQTITTRWEAFSTAWENEEAQVCADFYTEEATNIPPGMDPKRGRSEIQAFYQMLFDSNLSSDYNHKSLDLHIIGTEAIEEGAFTVDWVRNDSSSWRYEARTLAHWIQDDEGEWRISKFVFNNP